MESELPGPPRNIYIYYIEGIVSDREEKFLGPDFMGNWVEDSSSFLFFSAPAQEAVRRVVLHNPRLRLADSYTFAYEEWQGANFEELRIGSFVIQPAWSKASGDLEDGIPIVLDPGVVFGSGIHPTTGDCLRALEWIRGREAFRSVLDLGTGTGILSIAGVLLGADRAKALDLNPLCVKTSHANVRLNHCESRVEVVHGSALDAAEDPADVVVANIHHRVLSELIARAGFRQRRWLVLSGLLRSQARDIKDALARHGLKLVREWDHDMTWYTLVARHPDFVN